MSPNENHDTEVARLAHSIWESEGRPHGRDHEHWDRAREMLARGETTLPDAPRQVQPGFEDAAPGMVPDMERTPDPGELKEDAGGRFAQQIADLPEEKQPARRRNPKMPGPRNPAPIPQTGPGGATAIPSVEDAAAGALRSAPTKPRRRSGT